MKNKKKKSTGKLAVPFDTSSLWANYIFSAIIMPVILIYFEIILHVATKMEWTRSAWMYVLLVSLALGSVLFALSTLGKPRLNRIIVLVISFVIGFVYAIYQVYFYFFNAFIDFGAAGEAGNMIKDFLGNIISCTIKNLHWIALFLLPFFALLFLTKNLIKIPKTSWSFKGALAVFAILLFLLRTGMVTLNDDEYDDKFYYNDGYNVTVAASRFGLLSSIRLNAQYTIFGMPEAELIPVGPQQTVDIGGLFGTTAAPETQAPSTGSGSDSETGPIETEPPFVPIDQVMNINFEQLAANEKDKTIKAMHQYFGSLTPTQTNKYTGMFEGKNLIYITAEGFTSKIIDPQLTPTLYMMATQGFVFNNCYNSTWGGSTATGEYLSITGLFYSSSKCLEISGGGAGGGKRLMPFTMGNQFNKLGYSTYAFHNHTYTYYDRNLSHPNFGYNFIAANDGSYKKGITYTSAWPKSDLEMAQLSTSYFIDDEQFCAYYMTVSGHANYTFVGNAQARKHKDDVAHLNYSENVRAYIASQLELELFLESLCQQLAAKGKLEDTVFVLSSDHYPYALSDAELAELYGLPEDGIRSNFELYRNQFIIWSASMEEPVVVNKYCSSMDIVPTVSNLFGLEYDSRLLAGIDVLSSAPALVILNCDGGGPSWNWITDYGFYNTKTKKFVPHAGVQISSDSELRAYIQSINDMVANKRNYIRAILDNNYYSYVFK